VQNPRRGEGEHKQFLVVDLVIYDEETIKDIENGKREVSCGYNPDYLEILDDDGNAIPGRGEQANIIYNHLALVDRGRCGPRCSIGDHKTVDHEATKPENKERKSMSVKSAMRKLSRAFAAKDANAFDDALEELEDNVGDAGEEKQPDTIEVHNHIPGMDGIGEMPPKNPATTGARDDEQPEWFKNFSNECMDRFKSMDDKFEAMGGKSPVADPDGSDDDEGNLEMDSRYAKDAKDGFVMYSPNQFGQWKAKAESMGDKVIEMMDESPNEPAGSGPWRALTESGGTSGEFDKRKGGHLQQTSDAAKDDEANKKILGELEFEAPPGTGYKATKAKDSVYLEDSFQDVISKAEILAPGIRVPTFDRKSSPVKTVKALFGLRRTALDLAYGQAETRGIIDSALSGRTFDSKKMPDAAVRVLFNAVASQAARDNNARSTADRRTVRPANGGGHSVGAKLTSLASINERNREKFGRKSA